MKNGTIAASTSEQHDRWRRRLSITSRIVAAMVGGYILDYAATACLAVLLPMPKSEAVLTAAIISFVIYTGAILFAFAASTATRAWIWLLAPAAFFAAIAFPPVWLMGK